MPSIAFTPEQRQAIETTGTSVLVTAAAGSGKTAVLAERCAYLVCDAPPDARCDIDQLLVLTFTDAAAAEMRTRIIEAIRLRAEHQPGGDRVRKQLAIAGTARISTIHSFCLWLVRRWFSELGVDPSATVLDADEARLLQHDVLDKMFGDLFSSDDPGDDVLGMAHVDRETSGNECAALGSRFASLVEVYGLGDDGPIADLVRSLSEFVASVPDPDGWLRDAVESVGNNAHRNVHRLFDALLTELNVQAEHCERVADSLEAGHSAGHFHAGLIRAHAEQLRTWHEHAGTDGCDASAARFALLIGMLEQHSFDPRRGSKVGKDAEPEAQAARARAGEQWKFVKNDLFNARLRKRFALLSVDEWLEGLASIAPFVKTIADLVGAYRDAYSQRKRAVGVLDFADLERMAYDILRSPDEATPCSEVARTLHHKFAYVLVDEFQDVNPIQEAILKLASHETDANRNGNLFAVGDVKQSIYRFRLAEPAVFTKRLDLFRCESNAGLAISLSHNFRSRVEILRFVNHVFRQLMRPDSGIAYDADAELRPGRADAVSGAANVHPIELHVVQRTVRPEDSTAVAASDPAIDDDGADDEMSPYGQAGLNDPARWSTIEREAYVIGSRIREWIDSAETIVDGRALRYRDVVVLLRAAKINAERIAAMLGAMQIPAYADVGGSLFGALEIRDVLAVLEVLDNAQQDIPLAAVLRSGIIAEALSEDDLVEIRYLDRSVPFHAAVRRYVEEGRDREVVERLAQVLRRIDAYRADARCKPLSEVLWNLYHQRGHMAHVGGLPNGVQRQANLHKLHELARQFGSFRRQGLHRFLTFIRAMEEKGQDVGAAPAIGESEDVVRVMSIHQAKGLEFPVVFVAGLGNRFNIGDRKGRMIFDRGAGIGLRVVDPQRMIEYPSAAHRLAEMEIDRSQRAEELRVLYVAMTRARERLVLIGSGDKAEELESCQSNDAMPLTDLGVETASCPLDWLIPTIGVRTDESDDGESTADQELAPPVRVISHTQESMASWRTSANAGDGNRALRKAVANGDPLPTGEPIAVDDPEVEEVIARIESVHPRLSTASIRATVAASEARGGHLDGSALVPKFEQSIDLDRAFLSQPSRYSTSDRDTSTLRGVITHRVLQHLDFTAAGDAQGVALELQRMIDEGIVSQEERTLVDDDAIVWFVSTPLAEAIRQAGDAYCREFSFVTRESPEYFDPNVDPGAGDFVLVRGIVDGIIPVTDGIDIVDFKTDKVSAADAEVHGERYRTQMELYARAMTRTWRQPVRRCLLVYLSARKILTIDPVGAETA